MSEKLTVEDIEVPEGMLAAAMAAGDKNGDCYTVSQVYANVLAAALLWQSENPRVPSEEEVSAMYNVSGCGGTRECIAYWQRVMYRKPTPKVPDAVEKAASILRGSGRFSDSDAMALVTEVYEAGKAAK